MARKSPICPIHKEKEQRAIGKNKRGFGRLAMKTAGLDNEDQADQITWCRKHDPLYKIKGMARIRSLELQAFSNKRS